LKLNYRAPLPKVTFNSNLRHCNQAQYQKMKVSSYLWAGSKLNDMNVPHTGPHMSKAGQCRLTPD